MRLPAPFVPRAVARTPSNHPAPAGTSSGAWTRARQAQPLLLTPRGPPAAAPRSGKPYTGLVGEQQPERKGLSPYAKAGAYAGLAFVTPISGWVCYKIGEWLDRSWGTSYLYLAGLIIGCVAGMYETYRQAVRIEGLDKRK